MPKVTLRLKFDAERFQKAMAEARDHIKAMPEGAEDAMFVEVGKLLEVTVEQCITVEAELP